MRIFILLMFIISCEKLDYSKYVILTQEGRWICDKDLGDKNYTNCYNDITKEYAISIFSGTSVVLEIREK